MQHSLNVDFRGFHYPKMCRLFHSKHPFVISLFSVWNNSLVSWKGISLRSPFVQCAAHFSYRHRLQTAERVRNCLILATVVVLCHSFTFEIMHCSWAELSCSCFIFSPFDALWLSTGVHASRLIVQPSFLPLHIILGFKMLCVCIQRKQLE